MQIVINIPDKEYEVILNNSYVAVCACPHLLSEAIKNGTPLPKGHGQIIDESKITNIYYHKEIAENERFRVEHIVIDGTDAPTIIESRYG